MTAAEALEIAASKLAPHVGSYHRSDLLIRLNAGSRLSPDETRKVLAGEYSGDAQMAAAVKQWRYLRGNCDRKAANKGEAFIRQYLGTNSLADGIEALHDALDRGERLPRVRMNFTNWIERTADARKLLPSDQRRSIAGKQAAFQRRLRKYELSSLQRAGVCP